MRTVGVEEELLLVDTCSGEPRALSTAVLAVAERRSEGDSVFEPELHRQQLEFSTEPCSEMRELAGEIRRWRAEAAKSAARTGTAVVALRAVPQFLAGVRRQLRHLAAFLERPHTSSMWTSLRLAMHRI
ncbi:glutamate-cysteine ligase family protein [Streptomyces sp. CLV115]|uniref:glutamate-cysteine ligase family protein n=1 Tax=Streptomyces sp. CLV115 TaxID=3138502 RepID=UPI00313ED6F1